MIEDFDTGMFHHIHTPTQAVTQPTCLEVSDLYMAFKKTNVQYSRALLRLEKAQHAANKARDEMIREHTKYVEANNALLSWPAPHGDS